MSGDVQPRKRKDKKRKKDDLGVSVSEPRGTAAALGDGDVFLHSHHEHGTGGHWCAKIVFFSLLAILIGLVGLIILENRGLSELEANAVQSQYSGVLEGWLEDAPEDDHHDEHTLDLNHHDDEDDDDDHELQHSEEAEDDHDEDNDHDEPQDDEENEDEEPQNYDDLEDDEDGSQEQDVEANDEDEDLPYRKYYQDSQATPKVDDDNDDDENDQDDDNDNGQDVDDDNDDGQDDDDDNDDAEDSDDEFDQNSKHNDEDDADDDEEDDDNRNIQSVENDENSQENDNIDEGNYINDDARDNEADSQEQNKEDDDEHEEEEEDVSLEVEKIEHEASDEDPISTELPALPEPDDDDANKDQESAEQGGAETDGDGVDTDDDDDGTDRDEADDFLDADDDDDQPPVERITAPAGKPFDEVEEETSSEKPADTLEDEAEYEKRQEALRREEAQTSHMWLKLTVGGALLVATHAIVRRATASSDAPSEEIASREETPTVARRMTLIAEERTESVPIRKAQESTRPVIQDVPKHIPSIIKSPPTFEESEDDVEEEDKEEPFVSKVVQAAQSKQAAKEELYSDDEDAEDDEIEEEVVVKKAGPQVAKQPSPEPEREEDVPDDVEIIDEEQIEEELEGEEDEEEEISDVDDEELLSRLEAKYGRLPEPERPQRHKDGGNSLADEWPGEPSDSYWRQQLDQAEREYDQGAWLAAVERASAKPLQSSARARYVVAKSLDAAAEKKRDNALLGRAIAAYLELLKMNERLSDQKLLQVTERTINRIQFRGNYLNAEPVYRLLIRRFPDEPSHRTNLTVTFLMANRADLAEEVLKETLKLWPDHRLALAQYGFVLKTQHNRLEEAVDHLQRALQGDTGPATEPRYYYHLGDTLLLLGRFGEAEEVHKRGAKHGHFLSPSQRSLYNVPRLKGQPWWKIEDTPYVNLVRSLEKSWRAILREGLAAKTLYEEEKEGLREKGEWSQLDLFVRGREVPGRCARAPVTCALVKAEPAAAGCTRGQVKFSSMEPGTHVRPHVGPTNCRLRMHLGLTNTKDTFLRVERETRQWKTGEVLIFDDSFEHEVWHNGSGARLVLIVDVWHPDLTTDERRQLPAI